MIPASHGGDAVPMRVTRLQIDRYEPDGWTHRVETIDAPEWADVEAAIRALDSFARPSLRLLLDAGRDDEECMAVMGGGGAYWLAVTAGPHDQRRLFDREKPAEEVVLWRSDQGFADDGRHVCDLGVALRAARYFADHGDCDPGLAWEG